MNRGKWFTLSLVTLAGWGAALGCGNDDEGDFSIGSGGSGGTAGHGGSGGGGTGGIGEGGVGGSGGSPEDGSAGEDSGDAGGTAKVCVEKCTTDDDCRAPGFDDAGPMDVGLVCNTEGVCESADKCTQASHCLGQLNHWDTPCNAGLPCDAGLACVDIGKDTGRCAPEKGDGGCSFIAPNVIVMPRFGDDAGTVEVCGEKQESEIGCSPQGGCYTRTCSAEQPCSSGPSFCVLATGICGCASDGECSADLGGLKCNTSTHTCGCVTDADCAGVPRADKCFNGTCGCSGTSACGSPLFSGTSVSCE